MKFKSRRHNVIQYVSAPCGAGKTTAVCDLIKSTLRHETNVMVVLPTIKLTEEVEQKLKDLGLKPIVIAGDRKQGERSVRSAIMKALRNAPEHGFILLVTWNAFVDLPYFDRKQNWTIIIDEIPTVDSFESWTLPRNSMFITEKIEVYLSTIDGLSMVGALDQSALRDELEDHKDDAEEPFRELYGWLVSDSRSVYVETAAWEKFLQQDGTDEAAATISFLALLNPKLFENTIIMGANFEDSLLYHWLHKHASDPIEEHSVLTGLLRK